MDEKTVNQVPKRQKTLKEISENGHILQQEINPLYNEVVLENILKFLKGNRNALTLGKFRSVCKLWDSEISKMIRRDTFIILKNILRRYPEGMGWNGSRKQNIFQYLVPYPEVRAFENIKLVVEGNTWATFPRKERKVSKWFEIMGCQVKSIHFISSLDKSDKKCFEFLERILKEWCPNLQSLHLNRVRIFERLIFVSRFTDTTKGIVCKGLKDVKISFKWDGIKSTWGSPRKIPTILTKPKTFNKFIFNHGLPGSSTDFPEQRNSSGMKVVVPSELFEKSEFPDISQFIPENFFPEMFDGGILGQLIGCTSVEKFSLVGSVDTTHIRYLTAFFHYRKNVWRTSLKHLVLNLRCLKNISRDLVVLGKLKYPLVTLNLNLGSDKQNSRKSVKFITRFIANFAETLQSLEFAGVFNRANGLNTKFVLPLLPKLTTFVYRNYCNYELCPVNILTNLPSLKVLYLRCSNRENTGTSFFEINAETLMNDRLLELKIYGRISGAQGSQLLKWFPNVQRVYVSLQDTDQDISGFLKQLGTMEVEHLQMNWARINDNVRGFRCNTALICEINKLKSLKTLYLRFKHAANPFGVQLTAFTEGFGLLTELRVLKLTNFGVYKDDYLDIKRCLEYIPEKQFVNMSFHCSSSSSTGP